MFALFDDAGKFLAGRVMSEADASMQVELDSGKRVKVKAANLLLKFEKPAPSELIAQAHAAVVDDAVLVWVVHDTNPHALSPKVKKFVQAQHWFQDLTTIGAE